MDILDVAEQLDREELKKGCLHFIGYNFDGIQSSKKFKKLSKEKRESLTALKRNPADLVAGESAPSPPPISDNQHVYNTTEYIE